MEDRADSIPAERTDLAARLRALGGLELSHDLTAFVGAFLVFVGSNQGLFLNLWLEQPAGLAGVVAGLVCTGWWQAALVAALAVFGGTLVQSPWLFGNLVPGDPFWWRYLATMLVTAAAVGGIVGAGHAYVARRRAGTRWPWRYEMIVVCIAVVVVAGNLTSTAMFRQRLPEHQGQSGIQLITQRPKIDVKMTDDDFYRNVLWLMRNKGLGYYTAYRQAYRENAHWGGLPPFFLAYRLPTTYWMLNAMHTSGAGIFDMAIVAALIAVGGATALALQRARPALAFVATVVTASFYLYVVGQFFVLYAEVWAAPLAVTAVALGEMARRSKDRWRGLVVGAVVVAVAASLFREISAFVICAAVIGALFAPKERRRFLLVSWSSGLAVVLAALVAHWVAIGGAVSHVGASWLLRASLTNVAAGLLFGTTYVAAYSWLVIGLAGLAFVGAATAPTNGSRAFLLACLVLPLTGFALLYDGGVGLHGERINYWGTLVTPIAYGLVPWALALLPGGARDDLALSERLAAATGTGKTGTGDESDPDEDRGA